VCVKMFVLASCNIDTVCVYVFFSVCVKESSKFDQVHVCVCIYVYMYVRV